MGVSFGIPLDFSNFYSYIYSMYEWDERKAAVNLETHGVSFLSANDFDWQRALIIPDNRRDYGEKRFVAMAPVKDRLHVMVYTNRNGLIRLISFRKANRREVEIYVQNQDQTADEE